MVRITQAGDVVWAAHVGGSGATEINGVVLRDTYLYTVGTAQTELVVDGVSQPAQAGDAFVIRWEEPEK